jgi:hypothetical protein
MLWLDWHMLVVVMLLLLLLMMMMMMMMTHMLSTRSARKSTQMHLSSPTCCLASQATALLYKCTSSHSHAVHQVSQEVSSHATQRPRESRGLAPQRAPRLAADWTPPQQRRVKVRSQLHQRICTSVKRRNTIQLRSVK